MTTSSDFLLVISVFFFLVQFNSVSDSGFLYFSWHILMRMKTPKEDYNCDPIAPLELPHSLHAFHRVSETDELNEVG